MFNTNKENNCKLYFNIKNNVFKLIYLKLFIKKYTNCENSLNKYLYKI